MKKISKLVFILMVFSLSMQACNLPSNNNSQEPTIAPTQAPIATAVETPQEEKLVKPSSGIDTVARGHDNEESTSFAQKSIKDGELYDKNRFERPFTAKDMTYIPDVDIKDFNMLKDSNFYYAQIILTGLNPQKDNVTGYYGVEMDLNLDGRSDFLIITKSPLTSDWSREGVAAYLDSNGDVGGARPTHADSSYTGDGFDAALYDSGRGPEPDMAWARAVTGPDKAIVEIAFKPSLLQNYQNYKNFLFDVMASSTPLDPAKMYYSDSMSQTAAGSPIKGDYYPLKGLSAFDNTCRIPVGFEATGSEPLGCFAVGPDKDPAPAPPIVVPGKKG